MPAQSVKINLLPRQLMEERRMAKFFHWSITYGRYIIIFTELIVLLAFFSRFRLDQELTNLNESIKQKQQIIASVSQFENEVRKLNDRINKIDKLDEYHTLFTEALFFLDETVPLDVVLKTLSFQGTDVSLSGSAYSGAGFSSLLNNLRNSDKIRSLTINSVEKPEDSQRLDFSMQFQLVPEAFY